MIAARRSVQAASFATLGTALGVLTGLPYPPGTARNQAFGALSGKLDYSDPFSVQSMLT